MHAAVCMLWPPSQFLEIVVIMSTHTSILDETGRQRQLEWLLHSIELSIKYVPVNQLFDYYKFLHSQASI